MGWVVNATPRPLSPRKRLGTHYIGGWVGPRAGQDRCGKSRPHRDSIPGPSSPYSNVGLHRQNTDPWRLLGKLIWVTYRKTARSLVVSPSFGHDMLAQSKSDASKTLQIQNTNNRSNFEPAMTLLVIRESFKDLDIQVSEKDCTFFKKFYFFGPWCD